MVLSGKKPLFNLKVIYEREVLVVCNLEKMDGIFESNRIEGFKSEKNAIMYQSVLMK